MDKIQGLFLCYGLYRECHSLYTMEEEHDIIYQCLKFTISIKSSEKRKSRSMRNRIPRKGVSWLKDDGYDYTIQEIGIWTIKCVLISGLVAAVDIGLLAVNGRNDCNKAMEQDGVFGESEYVPFSLNQFIQIGCIMHLCYTFLGCGCHILSMVFAEKYEDNIIVDEGGGITYRWIMYLCCACCLWSFFVSWDVIGWYMWTEMRTNTMENKQCADVMLAWNIIKIIELVITPFIVALYSFGMLLMLIDDDD